MLKLAKAPLKRVQSRSDRAAPVKQTHSQKQAETLFAEGLVIAGLTPELIATLPGSDLRKVSIARAIWTRTTVSQKWLADRLGMGSAANCSQQLRRQTVAPPAGSRTWIKGLDSRDVD